MIEVTRLNKVFDNSHEALKSVDFSIKKNDLVCLLGPSGCGKSTILNLVAGLLTPTDGDIKFAGRSVIKTPPKDRNIGFVFQNYALYPHMTVLENVMFPLIVGKKKVKKEVAEKIANKYMALTNIEELSHKKPGKLSGGQQQRVAITRALVQEPDILLLDEPLSNLDAKLRLKIREEIRQIVKTVGITTIFVTHDQEEALSLEPNNLFVAQFIGNPSINIFTVISDNNQLSNDLFSISLPNADIKNGTYYLGVRPEDMIPVAKNNGLFKASVCAIELIGREKILNFSYQEGLIKSIVAIENDIQKNDQVDFDFVLPKLFLFKENGERVY